VNGARVKRRCASLNHSTLSSFSVADSLRHSILFSDTQSRDPGTIIKFEATAAG
jgi:hypothetical protein